MITEFNISRNNLNVLEDIDDSLYENIFSMYMKDNHYLYNIMKRVTVPAGKLDPEYYTYEVISADAPWTAHSYKYYKTIKLWWLICVLNNISNPVYNMPTGAVVKILKPQYVPLILRAIKAQTT